MRVWAIANQKGGVGKTTTAVSLAGLLAQNRKKVLLLDLDPHGSLTSYFRYDPEADSSGGYALFQRRAQGEPQPLHDLLQPSGIEGIDLLCASTAMATLDRQLSTKGGMGLVVADAIKTVSSQYDRVIIDCPPMLGVLMVNALAACEHLLIPVQTEFLALKGLERMLRTVSMVSRSRLGGLKHTIVPTLFDRRTRASLDTLKQLRRDYGDHVWRGVIPIDTQFREASKSATPLTTMRPGARGSRAYALLLEWLEEPELRSSQERLHGTAI
ncbi:ParA family protein [Acidihalobacter prosperus]